MYDVSDLNVSNVSDCVKDGAAIIYQGLWGTGPFTRAGAQLICGGPEPTWPIAGYGPVNNMDRQASMVCYGSADTPITCLRMYKTTIMATQITECL